MHTTSPRDLYLEKRACVYTRETVSVCASAAFCAQTTFRLEIASFRKQRNHERRLPGVCVLTYLSYVTFSLLFFSFFFSFWFAPFPFLFTPSLSLFLFVILRLFYSAIRLAFEPSNCTCVSCISKLVTRSKMAAP